MKLRHLEIKNFKGLKDIQLITDKNINVIVGPNAVGKTTILDAIRLLKCVLSPRFTQEAQVVLQSMGALSPQFTFLGRQGFDYSALANDIRRDLEIRGSFELNLQEVNKIKSEADKLALSVLQGQMAHSTASGGHIELTQYLSTENGKKALDQAKIEVTTKLAQLEPSRPLQLQLRIGAGSSTFSGNDLFTQLALAALEEVLPPQYAKMSYFPADRSFPAGEVAVQLGSQDALQQLYSHMSQPTIKYGRLKIMLAQEYLVGLSNKDSIKEDFGEIFATLLSGKRFSSIITNNLGVLKVMVEDVATQKSFDIDNLSSGEKGLVSIFFLLKQTVADGGIFMLDEPELHLNPAVVKNMLPYIKEQCQKRDLQAFICTHSPEILGDANEMDECNLFHLRSGEDLTPVYREDSKQALEILDRLGVSTADVLFSKGQIFVEGEHDEEILTEGFASITGSYKITPLKGRSEIEKSIRSLQISEDNSVQLKLFVLDGDRKPTDLRGKGSVQVIQWDRYCLENYLLEDKQLFDVVTETAQSPPGSRGEFMRDLKQDALAQIDGYVVREIYQKREPENAGLRSAEIKNLTITDATGVLATKLCNIRDQLKSFESSTWSSSFIQEAEARRDELKADWDLSWKKSADGKALIDQIYIRYRIRMDKLLFKRRVVRLMRQERSEIWLTVSKVLEDALRVAG